MKKIWEWIKNVFSIGVKGFLAGVAVTYPGLVEFLSSFFAR